MSVKLSDIVGTLPNEAMVFMVLSSISPGNSIESKYGTITRVTDEEFNISINDAVSMKQDLVDEGDPDAGLRKIFK